MQPRRFKGLREDLPLEALTRFSGREGTRPNTAKMKINAGTFYPVRLLFIANIHLVKVTNSETQSFVKLLNAAYASYQSDV